MGKKQHAFKVGLVALLTQAYQRRILELSWSVEIGTVYLTRKIPGNIPTCQGIERLHAVHLPEPYECVQRNQAKLARGYSAMYQCIRAIQP